MQFKIIRDKSGMARLYPKYHLVLADKDIYLATAKMLAFQKTSKYIFTLKKEDTTTKNKLNYIARLRSNFMGTEFMLYDNGLSPEDARHPDQVRC
jgi:tubby-related protein 1